jgi:hypothetical protein
MGLGDREAPRVRLAYWTELDPQSRRLRSYAARLVPELARQVEIGVFVDGDVQSIGEPGITFRDARTEHYRNALSDYDACLYDVGPGPAGEWLLEPLREWPGLVAIHGDDLDLPFHARPELRRRVLDRAVGVVVNSEAVTPRIRMEHPWTSYAVVAVEADPASAAATCLDLIRRGLRARPWLESLLEAAAAEIPGFFPGDRAAAWREEIDELVRVGDDSGR